ncbi:MAG: hypothetical protein F4Y44_08320 [Chloroflexi bacterium]|nr:hypothetical protein [Chloroflexota bacterium]
MAASDSGAVARNVYGRVYHMAVFASAVARRRDRVFRFRLIVFFIHPESVKGRVRSFAFSEFDRLITNGL